MAKQAKDRKRRWKAALVAGLVATGALAGGGWIWLQGLHVRHVEVTGTRHASPDTLAALAGVDTSMVLFDVDPVIVADRVRRHPWVREARATRLPTGTLWIRVAEREPAALVLDGAGRPAYFLDGEGFPVPVDAAYDVPLVRGLPHTYHPMRRVEEPHLRELLAALAAADAGTDALISELEVTASGDVWLYTSPAGDRGALPVRLGRGGYAEKLARLYAFWHQAVLTQPDKTFDQIDLRFDSQIITKEAVGH